MSPNLDRVEEALAVIRRLERIEALDREHAQPEAVIAELRELVREAEEWVRAEGEPPAAAAAAAVDRVTQTLDGAIITA